MLPRLTLWQLANPLFSRVTLTAVKCGRREEQILSLFTLELPFTLALSGMEQFTLGIVLLWRLLLLLLPLIAESGTLS